MDKFRPYLRGLGTLIFIAAAGVCFVLDKPVQGLLWLILVQLHAIGHTLEDRKSK